MFRAFMDTNLLTVYYYLLVEILDVNEFELHGGGHALSERG